VSTELSSSFLSVAETCQVLKTWQVWSILSQQSGKFHGIFPREDFHEDEPNSVSARHVPKSTP